jgi:tetratricopeptide (TPR) repeat protein
MARSYQALGNYQRALDYYQKALELNPDDLLLRYEQAKLMGTLKQFEEAKQNFEILIESDSLNPNFYFEMGKLLEQTNDSTAIRFYNTTYNLDATHQKAIYKIARHKLVKRKHLESIEYADKGLKLYAENLELISLKAQNYYWMEDYDNAILWFEKLIALGERSELIYEKLSRSYAKNYNFQKAIDYRKKTLSYNPNNAEALYALGVYHQELQYFKEAEEYIAMALTLKDVSLSDEYQRLGVVLNRQKKFAQAIEAFQKSLEEDPSNISSAFFMVMTKDQYYEDIDARIKAFQDFEKKHGDSPFATFAKRRVAELKDS